MSNVNFNVNARQKKNTVRLVVIILAVILLVVLGTACTAVVPTGYTGILTTFGRVADYTLDAGFHLKSPFQQVINMDNREQKNTFATEAFSSDIQQVNVRGSVNYNINKTTAMNLFKDVGVSYFGTLVYPRLMENMKAVFSKYTAEELISSREQLSIQVRDNLKNEMNVYGINIISVSIEDIDFADAFTDAVEAKQVAQQSKLKAEIEQAQATMEAQQAAERQRIQAQADADVARIQAEAAQYAGEREAEMNRKLNESLTPELVQYYYAQRWDGKLPTYMAGEGSTMLPILDMGK
ncbi:MAG: prohibitin family protein [Clostridia bacterium]|nr:prohibitin family protein [Clostridia bacterium]